MNPPRARNSIGWMLGVLMFAAAIRAADAPPAVVSDTGAVGQAKAAVPTPGTTTSMPLFSEDFESGRLDPAIWTQDVTGGNLITVQREKAAHGSYALRVSCPAPSNKTWAFIMAKNLPAALRQHHFGRAYMLVTPKPPDRHTILLMAGTAGFPFNKFLEVATNAGQWQLTYVDLHPTGNKEDYHSGGLVPLNRWFCLEWEFNDHPDHTTIWVDGKLVYETNFVAKDTGAVTDLVGGFSDLAFGFRLWGAAPAPFEVYYDDIALDTKRLGQLVPVPGK